MGALRNFGYCLNIGLILLGLLYFPQGLILSLAGLIFFWILKRGAKKERIRKRLKQMSDNFKELREVN